MSVEQQVAIAIVSAPFVLFIAMLATVCWLESRPAGKP